MFSYYIEIKLEKLNMILFLGGIHKFIVVKVML